MRFLTDIGRSMCRRSRSATPPMCDGTADRLARRHLMLHRRLETRRQRLQRHIARAEHRRDPEALRLYSWQLAQVLDQLRVIEWIGHGHTKAAIQSTTVVVSSWLLRDSFRVCTEIREEGMHFLAGYNLDGLAIATRIIRCRYASRSWASAGSDQVSTQQALIASHDCGHRLVAILHAHPGAGPVANHPSSVDKRTHHAFEQSSRVIGGIWSRDGFVRWFSVLHPFRVIVPGSDVEHIDEYLFRLKMDAPPLEV